MKQLIYNMGYFMKEVKTIFRSNLLSNIFSLLSTSLIFFVLALVLSGWWVSSQVMETLQGEAEIAIYLVEELRTENTIGEVEEIKNITGVKAARVIDEAEAYERMVKILGKEAKVLTYFEDNPFGAFIEAQIDLTHIDGVMSQLGQMKNVEHVRDNREVLDRLSQITKVFSLLGYLVVAAVGITTLVIISHIIRQGIYNNRDQINTLQLLGAPQTFIAFPFLIEGLLVTIVGGLLACGLTALIIQQVYVQMVGPLPFIPLPPRAVLLKSVVTLVIVLSTLLGIAGSLFGIASSKER